MEFQPCKTIDEVIDRLNEVLNEAIAANSAEGIFPALYVVVTEKIREGIARGDVFQDNARMEKLDVIFANRYLKALWQYDNGKEAETSRGWKVAFNVAKLFPSKVILQEMLVGINAHVNYDLGISADEVMAGKDIQDLKKDFNAINKILGALVDDVKEDISKLSPRFHWILRHMVGEDVMVNFSLRIARQEAWGFAKDLHKSSGKEKEALLEKKNEEIAKLGRKISSPGFIGNLIIWWVNMRESKDIPHIVSTLRSTAKAKIRFPDEIPD